MLQDEFGESRVLEELRAQITRFAEHGGSRPVGFFRLIRQEVRVGVGRRAQYSAGGLADDHGKRADYREIARQVGMIVSQASFVRMIILVRHVRLSVVLISMVAEVVDRLRWFMRAVFSCGCPGNLERQQADQQDGEKVSHRPHYKAWRQLPSSERQIKSEYGGYDS
jgi:hypothetical protein